MKLITKHENCSGCSTCRLQMMELGFEAEEYAELYSVITGDEKSWQELINVSERVWHLTRAFSVREIDGFGRHHNFRMTLQENKQWVKY